MKTASCTDCGRAFYRDPEETWKRTCLRCWKASKEQTSDGDEYLAWYRKGYAAGLEAAEAKRAPKPSLDPARLRELLQLAHPGKHNGSELSSKVTAWLLDLRKRVTA